MLKRMCLPQVARSATADINAIAVQPRPIPVKALPASDQPRHPFSLGTKTTQDNPVPGRSPDYLFCFPLFLYSFPISFPIFGRD